MSSPGGPPDDGPHDQLTRAVERSIEEGVARLERTTPSLLATGFVGGTDVSLGVFALLIVENNTGSRMLGALAFTIGFVALSLAGSELFTENFLVPLSAVVAHRARWWHIGRLWAGTALTNLLAGWLIMGLVVSGYPKLGDEANKVAAHYSQLGIGWASFAGAMLGGLVITLMTWMERSTDSVVAKLVGAVSAAFILAAAPLNHVVVMSIEMFAALQRGAPFGYASWAGIAAWSAAGNAVGGIALVSGLRIIQVGPRRLAIAADTVTPDSPDPGTEGEPGSR